MQVQQLSFLFQEFKKVCNFRILSEKIMTYPVLLTKTNMNDRFKMQTNHPKQL